MVVRRETPTAPQGWVVEAREAGTRWERGVMSWHQKGTSPRVILVGKVTSVGGLVGCEWVGGGFVEQRT